MKILYICHRVPFPPKRGGKIRPFNMISHFSNRHMVTVASLARDEEERCESAGLIAYCEKVLCEVVTDSVAFSNMLMNIPSRTPFSMGYFYSRRLQQLIDKELAGNGYDLIFVHCSSVAPYVSEVADIPKVLDFGDMDSEKWKLYSKLRKLPMSLVYGTEGRRLERSEKILSAKFDLCTCTTREELKTLDAYQPASATSWFPNGVDLEYFSPDEGVYDPTLISFVGRMDYYPNQECVTRFCRNVLPVIRKSRPETKLVVIGANPPKRIQKLAQIDGVEVTGTVDDVRPFVKRSAVNVATLSIARGTQNKILESMAMGVPVVASRQAAAGVDAVVDESILVSDDPDEEARTILKVLDDSALRKKLAVAARARVKEKHDWNNSMKKLDAILVSRGLLQ